MISINSQLSIFNIRDNKVFGSTLIILHRNCRTNISIARNSDWVLPIYAGIEIGVASTKAFLGQLTVLYILCLKIAFVRKDIDESTYVKKIMLRHVQL